MLLTIFISCNCQAQSDNFFTYTTKDGLPSNYVYRVIEDDAGYLWVATEAGIARFDGKHFQVFTTRDGLPDNEVLEVVKEKNGRVWVNCFKQGPAYFDAKKNRFINASEDPMLAKNLGSTVFWVFPLDNGGVVFYNENGATIFRDHKCIQYKIAGVTDGIIIKEYQDGSQVKWNLEKIKRNGLKRMAKMILVRNNRVVGRINLNSTADMHTRFIESAGVSYEFQGDSKKCYRYYDITTDPLRCKRDSLVLAERCHSFDLAGNTLYFVGNSGKIYVFNKTTLQLERTLSGDYLPNAFFKDSKGNLWVSTIDKGLLVYRENQLGRLQPPRDFSHTNFMSIARKPDGTILAGNYYGEVIESKGKKFQVHRVADMVPQRERKILISGKDVYSFSEDMVNVNFKDKLIEPSSHLPLIGMKTAINYNDSSILIGSVSDLRVMDTRTKSATKIKGIYHRITCLGMDVARTVYFGSTDGLYQYNYSRQIVTPLNLKDKVLKDRIAAICGSPDSLVWVATAGNGVAVIKNNKLFTTISEANGIVNNACRSITNGRPGQIWVGTTQGISIINYRFTGGDLQYSIRNLSVNDGLTNNIINEMDFVRDTIYAATSNGISIIPAGYTAPKFDIPVKLISISINQRDTMLASSYKLNTDQQNIQMQFFGIELDGHLKNLQYSLDNERWIVLRENTLAVELSQEHHFLRVRAVDVNGNVSGKICAISFDIATPFWKTVWFWIVFAALTQILVIYLVNRRQKRKKELRIEKKLASIQTASLEQQAFTSLMNPHFMFNALNSIQHYINLQDRQNANRYLSDFASLIRTNFEAVQQSFTPLDQELESIKIYLRLEQMRFNDRFEYHITVGEDVETEEWMIPSMILQPLLENALLHGIMPSLISGEIGIDISQKNDFLHIIITDNGIGIRNSLALKQNTSHISRGSDLIRKRITALNQLGSEQIAMTMEPVFEDDHNPGNRILLVIPYRLHDAWSLLKQ
ncbi:MAG TPA: histidine kinase [Mucilaginibacter sp.]|nr:histidine kinase [Mucilaginibacter sp.]